MEGPSLTLTPNATQTLGMALHELATNAAKYGALSNAEGRIAVTWSVETGEDAAPRFTMGWQERDGPKVAVPERHGFGSRVTSRMVKSATRGEVSVDYAPEGLAWRLSCPAAVVLREAEGAGSG
jgi:two-component sensor histidine kinase